MSPASGGAGIGVQHFSHGPLQGLAPWFRSLLPDRNVAALGQVEPKDTSLQALGTHPGMLSLPMSLLQSRVPSVCRTKADPTLPTPVHLCLFHVPA